FTKSWRFITMKLGESQPAVIEHAFDHVEIVIHKHPHRNHERWEPGNDVLRGGRLDISGALSIKHKSQCVSSFLNRDIGILLIRNATNFNFKRHRVFAVY